MKKVKIFESNENGYQFTDSAKFSNEDWGKWKSEVKTNKDIEITIDGNLELVYTGNKHIGTYDTKNGVIMTDNLSMFGNPINESKVNEDPHDLFDGKPTVIITEEQFVSILSSIGMSFTGGWKQWSNNDIQMVEDKLNIHAEPVQPYEGKIKLSDLNYNWDDESINEDAKKPKSDPKRFGGSSKSDDIPNYTDRFKRKDNTKAINEMSGNPLDIDDIVDIINYCSDEYKKGIKITTNDLTREQIKKFNNFFDELLDEYPEYNPFGDNKGSSVLAKCSKICDDVLAYSKINESANFEARDIAMVVNATNSKGVDISENDITPTMIAKFNKGMSDIMDKYPDYNPFDDNYDGADYAMNLTLSDSIINDIVDGGIVNLPNPVNESETDKSKEIKDVIASTTPDREAKLKELNQYFVNLQNKGLLTPSEENQWKKVSKAINGKVNENQYVKEKPNGKWGVISAKTGKFWDADYDTKESAEDGFKAYEANKHKVNEDGTNEIKQRLMNLSFSGLKSLCADYEFGERIMDSSESREEIEDCLVLAFEEGLLDEIYLITVEDGE